MNHIGARRAYQKFGKVLAPMLFMLGSVAGAQECELSLHDLTPHTISTPINTLTNWGRQAQQFGATEASSQDRPSLKISGTSGTRSRVLRFDPERSADPPHAWIRGSFRFPLNDNTLASMQLRKSGFRLAYRQQF